MSPRELALRYLDIFVGTGSAGGAPLEAMLDVLHPTDFRFEGPFAAFDSAAAYVQALRDDPPLNCSYEPIAVLEQRDEACVVYDFVRDELRAKMSQLVRVRDGRICHLLLIFDSAPFVEAPDRKTLSKKS